MSERLIAIGDIHGCYDQFRKLVETRIRAEADDTIILIGDYIDRGLKSKEVIDYIIGLQAAGFSIIPLRGNHEAMLINALDDERKLLNWLWNGGDETLKSFNINSPAELDPVYKEFFRMLAFYHVSGNKIFVHAGFNDTDEDPFQDRSAMLWTRREEYFNPVFNGKIIIHGHTPIPVDECRKRIKTNNKVINIDTGCVYSDPGYGRLTAIDLTGMELIIE